jgi:uncharacterized protein
LCEFGGHQHQYGKQAFIELCEWNREKLAENIVNYRAENDAFQDRKQLKKVPRLGEKAYQQGVAFIRIPNAINPLDNSAVHPEAYPIVEKMAKDLKLSLDELIANKEKTALIKAENYLTPTIGLLGLKDIIKELEKPGLDPRKTAKVLSSTPMSKPLRMSNQVWSCPGLSTTSPTLAVL